MKNKNIEKLLIVVPFILGILLLIFFIYNDLYLGKKLLTNEWLYIVLGLFIFSLVPNLMVKIITEKLQDNQIDDHIKKCIGDEIKRNPNITKLNENISKIKVEVGELGSKKISNKEDIRHKNVNLVNIIFEIEKENKNIEVFKRNNSGNFGLKGKHQILLCGNSNVSLKLNKLDIKEILHFNEYLKNNKLDFFINKLNIDEYGRTINTAKDYKWVRLELNDIDLNNVSDKNNFKKLLELVIKNNEK